MKRNSLYFVFILALCSALSAQTTSLSINPGIVMPEDSLEAEALLTCVNGFLSAVEEEGENDWVLPAESMTTQLLIDEISEVQKSEALENDSFFKPYLTNIIPLENDNYAVHISYIGVEEKTANLRASFELIAHKNKDAFLITSPLLRNTKHWETMAFENQIYHYPYEIEAEKIERIYSLTTSFDQKLKNTESRSVFYLCNNELNPLNLFGVNYKSDYNGDEINTFWETAVDKKTIFVINGSRFYDYPEHDLWHFRLSEVISRKEVHKRVDCHIAYLYGGSWGFSWEELFPQFTEKFVVDNKVDWLDHKESKSHFETDGHKNYTDDFIGALLVKEIEKEKGFEGVWELLMTKRTKDEAEYFAALDNLLGINKDNYNKKVYKLIKEEMNNFES